MSSTVDTRVVEMQFNNKQFEKNVHQSMSTLKELRRQLNETESASGLEKLAESAKSIDLSGLANSISNIERRFSTFGIVGMTVIQNLTTSAMNAVKNISSYITGMIKNGGLNRAMNIEKAKFSLEGLGVAWNTVSEQINFAVNNTAYGLDQAAVATSSLVASGVGVGNVARSLTAVGEAGEMGVDYIDSLGMSLKAISGVAAQTNSDFASIADIFTTIAGQGKLMTMQMNQFNNRGLNVAAKLGEVLGKTEAEIRDMVSKGKIDFETFSGAMFDLFAEHAGKANDTVTGVISNIKSAFSKIGADIFQPIIKNEGPLVKMLDTIRAKVNEFRKMINGVDQFANNISYVVLSAIESIRQAVNRIDLEAVAAKLNNIGQTIKHIGQYLLKSIPVTASMFDTYFAPVFGKTTDTLDIFKKKLIESGAVLSGMDIDALIEKSGSFEKSLEAGWLTTDVFQRTMAYADQFVKAYEEGTLAFTEANKQEYNDMKKLLAAFYEGSITVDNFFETMNQPTAFELFRDGISNIFKGFGDILSTVSKAWSEMFDPNYSSIVMSIAAGFYNITKTFRVTEKQSSALTRTFKGLFAVLDVVRRILGSGLNFAITVLREVLNAFDLDIFGLTARIGDILVAFRDWYASHDLIRKATEALAKTIAKAITVVVKWIKTFKELPIVQSSIELIKTAITTLWAIAQPIFEAIGTAVDAMLDQLAKLDGFNLEAISNAFDSFKNKVAESSGNMKKFVSGIVSGIFKGASDGLKNILELIGMSFSNASGEAMSFKDAIISFLSGIDWGNLGALASVIGLLTLVIKLGGAIVKIIEPLKMLNEVVDAMVGTIKKIGLVFQGLALITFASAIMILVKALIPLANIDIGKLIKMGASLVILTAIMGGLMALASVFPVTEVIKSATVIGAMGGALLILAGAFALLSYSVSNNTSDTLNTAFVILVKLMVTMIAFSAIASIFAKRLVSSGLFLISFAAAVGILTIALMVLSHIPFKDITGNLENLSSMFIALIGVMALGRIAGDGAAKFGLGILALSAGLLVLVGVVILLEQVKIKSVENGLILMGLLAVLFLAFATAARIGGEHAAKAGVGLLAMSGALVVLVGLVAILKYIGDATVKRSLIILGLLTLLLDSMLVCLGVALGSKSEEELKGIKKVITSLGLIMIAMVAGIIILAKCDQSAVRNAMAAVALIAIALAYFAKTMSKTKNIKWKDMASRLDEFGVMAIAMIAIGVYLALISDSVKNPDAVIPLALGIAATVIAVGVAIKQLDGIEAPDKKIFATLGGMALVLLAAGGAIGAVLWLTKDTNSNWTEIASVAAGLGIVLLAMAESVKILSNIDDIPDWKELVKLGAMMAVLAGIAFVIGYTIGELVKNMTNATQVIAAAASISLVMVAMAGVVILLANFVKAVEVVDLAVAAGAMVAMTLVMLGLVGLVYLLSNIENADAAANNLLKLAGVLVAMSICIAILGVVGLLVPGLVAGGIALVVVTLVLTYLVGVVEVMNQLGDVSKAVNSLQGISDIVYRLAEVIVLLGTMGLNSLAAIAGVMALTDLITYLGIATLILGEVFTHLADSDAILSKGIEVLGRLGDGVGLFLGGIVKGVAAAAIEVLPSLGKAMGDFWDSGMNKFITGISTIDPAIGDSMVSFATAIVAMMATGWVDSLLSVTGLFGKSTGMSSFASGMKELGEALGTFDDETVNVNGHSIKAKAEAVKYLMEAAQSLPVNNLQIFDWLSIGTVSIKDFATGIADLVPSLEEMSKADGIVPETITSIAEAVKNLIEASNKLPRIGGRLQEFIGNKKSLVEFANELTASQDGSVNIMGALAQIGEQGVDINKEGLDKAVDSLVSVIEAANKMPREGGGLQLLMGNIKSLKSLTTDISSVSNGMTLAQALTKLGEDGTNINVDGVENVMKAIKTIEESLPTEVGSIEKFFFGGKLDIGEFGNQLGTLASGVSNFVVNLSGVDDAGLARMESVAKFINVLGTSLDGIDTGSMLSMGDIGKAGSDIAGLGSDIAKFVKALNKVDFSNLEVYLDGFEQICGVFKSVMGTDTEGFSSIVEAMSKSTDMMTNSMFEEIDSFENQTKASNAIESILKAMATKIETSGFKILHDKLHPVLYKLTGIVNGNDLYSARAEKMGIYIVEGIGKGLANEDATNAVYKCARTLVDNIMQEIQDEADINSPSKKSAILGRYISEGLGNGISDYSNVAVTAAKGVTTDTLTAMRDAIANIGTAVDSNVDISPTITPVMDFSALRSGLQDADAMISKRELALSTSMSASSIISMDRGGDGYSLGDVVSKLAKLDDRLSEMEVNNYTVNGLTYDDGTAVASAVKSLVRASKIERRM